MPNAEASIQGEQRYILYNPVFLKDVKETTKSNWASISILAHEIGHHLLGHTLGSGGSSPNLELEADYFSGSTLQKMGSPLATTTLGMDFFAMETVSLTHPKRLDRVEAMRKGWSDSNDKFPQIANVNDLLQSQEILNEVVLEDNTQEAIKIKNLTFVAKPKEGAIGVISTRNTAFVSNCVFFDDAINYLVMEANNIVVVKNGKFSIVAQKIASKNPNYSWIFKTELANFLVKKEGNIVVVKPNGSEFEVGYVTFPY